MSGNCPPQRHKQIFETVHALGSGEVLVLTNDHDPKPLYYLLQAEYAGQFVWSYRQQGPEAWIVNIQRV